MYKQYNIFVLFLLLIYCVLSQCIVMELQVVETTVEIANKVGVSDVISRIVEGLKDDNEPYRRMVMETIEQVTSAHFSIYRFEPP